MCPASASRTVPSACFSQHIRRIGPGEDARAKRGRMDLFEVVGVLVEAPEKLGG